MSRKAIGPGWSAFLGVLAIAAGVAMIGMMAACRPIAAPPFNAPADLTTWATCPGESGPTSEWAPCAWDSSRAPDQLHTPEYAWVIYAEFCPVTTVQTRVSCITHDEWRNQ